MKRKREEGVDPRPDSDVNISKLSQLTGLKISLNNSFYIFIAQLSNSFAIFFFLQYLLFICSLISESNTYSVSVLPLYSLCIFTVHPKEKKKKNHVYGYINTNKSISCSFGKVFPLFFLFYFFSLPLSVGFFFSNFFRSTLHSACAHVQNVPYRNNKINSFMISIMLWFLCDFTLPVCQFNLGYFDCC